MNVGEKIRLFILIGKQTKRNGTASARQFHEKKKSYVTLVFFLSKKSYQFTHDHVLGFLRKCLFCCLKYDFTRQLHRDERFIVFFLHHVPCHLALSRPVLVFCVLWVTCDILQMYTQWGYVVYYWNHPLTLHTFSNALQFKTFSANSRSCKRKPIS